MCVIPFFSLVKAAFCLFFVPLVSQALEWLLVVVVVHTSSIRRVEWTRRNEDRNAENERTVCPSVRPFVCMIVRTDRQTDRHLCGTSPYFSNWLVGLELARECARISKNEQLWSSNDERTKRTITTTTSKNSSSSSSSSKGGVRGWLACLLDSQLAI